jgi:hypothetical protein
MYLGYVLPTLLSILQSENQFYNLRFQHLLDFETFQVEYLCNYFFTNV